MLWNHADFQTLTWRAFGTTVLSQSVLWSFWGVHSSYSGLVFPCFIHGDDNGFTPWVDLNMNSLPYVLEQHLSWILCTYLLSILDVQNFPLHFTLQEVNTNEIHLMKIFKYTNRDNSLQYCWLKHKHKATEYRFRVVAIPPCAFNIINLVLTYWLGRISWGPSI